jgi:outer membrane protein OmpA-like peptidoglycan-associated protein
MDTLRRLGSVNEELRGTVISLPGEMLFPADGATPLVEASVPLDAVAELLKAGRSAVIESPGPLAQERAAALRDDLLARGVPAERIRLTPRPDSANLQILLER